MEDFAGEIRRSGFGGSLRAADTLLLVVWYAHCSGIENSVGEIYRRTRDERMEGGGQNR